MRQTKTQKRAGNEDGAATSERAEVPDRAAKSERAVEVNRMAEPERAGNQDRTVDVERAESDAEVDRHIGQRIRRLRVARGMPIPALAKAVGVGKQTMAKYEVGQHALRAARLLNIAVALRCSVDDLMLGLPGAEHMGDETVRAMRAARGYVARWGLDHPEPQARKEARATLQLEREDSDDHPAQP